MEIKVETMHRSTLVRLSGAIDSASAPALEASLTDLIESGARNLAINLEGVTFISSAGLRTLVGSQIKVRRRVPRGEVALACPNPHVREVLELTGMHHLFALYDTELQAVGSF